MMDVPTDKDAQRFRASLLNQRGTKPATRQICGLLVSVYSVAGLLQDLLQFKSITFVAFCFLLLPVLNPQILPSHGSFRIPIYVVMNCLVENIAC